MKKLLYIILVFLLLAGIAWAEVDEVVGCTSDTCDEFLGCSTADCDEFVGGTVSAAVSWLFEETFDGSSACGDGSHTNCDNAATSVGTVVNFDATGLEGTYGCSIDSDNVWQEIEYDSKWTAQDEVYLKIIKNYNTMATGGVRDIIFLTSSGSPQANFQISSDQIRCKHGTNNGSTGSTTLTSATTYYIWLYYKKSSGSNDGILRVWINTTDSKPGSAEADVTNGTSTSQIDGIDFRSYQNEVDYTFDHVRVLASEIN